MVEHDQLLRPLGAALRAMPSRSLLAASKVTITCGRCGYSLRRAEQVGAGQEAQDLGTSKGWSPNEAMIRWAADPARASCASA